MKANSQCTPVAYTIQSVNDGSLFDNLLAMVGWDNFNERMDALKNHGWIKRGTGRIVPLYLSAQTPSEREQIRAEALEEAARLCITHDGIAPFMADGRTEMARAIRALKNAAPQDRMGESASGAPGNSPAPNASPGDLPAVAAPIDATPKEIVLATEQGLTPTGEHIAECERDAKRYRWLTGCSGRGWEDLMMPMMTGQLGEVIDAAIAEQDGNEGTERGDRS